MSKNKILIVEDEHISLAMAEHILSGRYEIFCASSSKDATRIYLREKPDLVLANLRMPETNGFELQQNLQRKTGHPIPFIFLSPDPGSDFESLGLEADGLNIIVKPYRADVMLHRIGDILHPEEPVGGRAVISDIDPMTGLLNKASVKNEIDSMCSQSKGALMLIDLDNFKPVNDTYGHDTGDKVLIRLAEIIRSAVRSTDIAGRMGGDQFIVFCQNVTDEDVISGKARYINDHLVHSILPYIGEDIASSIGISVGCSLAPLDGKDFITLFKKADKALYSVKDLGRHGCAVYHEKSASEAKETGYNTNLGNTMALLGERAPEKGALVLSLDQFRLIYQFLCRVNVNYQKKIHFVLFSLKNRSNTNAISSDTVYAFMKCMRSSLRQSDVITQESDDQFLLLLLKTTPPNALLVIKRILDKWDSLPESRYADVTYDMQEME
ncbi:MAG: GGDEF domain-containing response regulator [Lachnospiraceae bacterium]|nr:GGDEF domain-containing response regulator [Lachnospiraceae bacterium]